MRAWLLSALLFPCLAHAQSPATPYPLTNLTVRGNKHFTPAEIAGAAGLKLGQSVNKDIFDAARAKNLRIVGLNAPIELVKIVAKKGLSSLTPEQRASLPASIQESSDARYQAFVKDSLSGHGLPPESVTRMIQAQAVWNETMGARTAELAASSRVLVIAGQGHMFWHAGIPESAARRGVGSIAVVLPYPLDGEIVPIPDQLKRLRDPANGELSMADAFVLIP